MKDEGPVNKPVTVGERLVPWDVLRFWLPPFLWAVLIFCGSSLASGQSPAPLLPGLYWDKVGHEIEYAVLGALLCRAFVRQEGFGLTAAILLSVLFGALYGASDEVHQLFVPGRMCEAGDVIADGSGSFIGAVVCALFRAWARRRAARTGIPAV